MNRFLDGEAPSQRVHEILRARAQRLAEPVQVDSGADLGNFIPFRIAGESLAIELRYLREVLRSFTLTRLPHTPTFCLGVTSLRGQILSVFDLGARRGATPAQAAALLLVLGRERAELGIVVDAVGDVTRFGAADFADRGGKSLHKRHGVTRDAITVLDGEALLDDEGWVIDPRGPGRA